MGGEPEGLKDDRVGPVRAERWVRSVKEECLSRYILEFIPIKLLVATV